MQINRGVARRNSRCAQARTRFTPRQRFAKAKLCLSIKAFCAVRIFAGLRGGVRIARRVAEVARIEQNEIRDRAVRSAPDFVSLNPGYACWNLRKTALFGFFGRCGGLRPPRGEDHLPGSE
jgi:hypothetical protein